MTIIKIRNIVSLAVLILFAQCSEDETPSPFTVNFGSSQLSIAPSSPEAEIKITFSRPATEAGNIQISLSSEGLEYGETKDFYTTEAFENNTISLSFDKGDQEVLFKIQSGSSSDVTRDVTLTLTIRPDAQEQFIAGNTHVMSILFSENFISKGASLTLDAGGEGFIYRAFLDLSKAVVTSIAVDDYDLGFYTGEGFYVTLNASAYLMARPLTKNDLKDVTASDTVGFSYEMGIPPPNFDASIGSVAWIDSPDGLLTTTAFGEISAVDTENKVFIIKRAKGNWQKVRVLRNGTGYKLQHADLAATAYETIEITKNDDYDVITVDLDKGIVAATPTNDRWDLMYSTYTEVLNFGGDIPYAFKDYITINRSDVTVATVMMADFAFETFTSAQMTGLTFKTEVNAIGSSWRKGGGPNSAPEVHKDRYFIIKDGENNSYKLRFTQLTSDTGERGKPSFIYEIL